MDLQEITPDVIRKYILQLGTTRNAGGLHAAYRAIRAFLLWYEDEFEPEGWRNPIRKVHPPKVIKKALPGVPVGDIRRMVAACTTSMGKRDKAILLCLADTGSRASECVALNIRDVDFITGAVKIAHGKGGKSRTVFLGKMSIRVVWLYLADRDDSSEDDPLFVSVRGGGPMDRNSIRQIVSKLGKRAGVKKVHPHRFRHTFAIQFLRNGGDVYSLQRILGHSTLDMVKRYVNLAKDDAHKVHKVASPVDRWKLKA